MGVEVLKAATKALEDEQQAGIRRFIAFFSRFTWLVILLGGMVKASYRGHRKRRYSWENAGWLFACDSTRLCFIPQCFVYKLNWR